MVRGPFFGWSVTDHVPMNLASPHGSSDTERGSAGDYLVGRADSMTFAAGITLGQDRRQDRWDALGGVGLVTVVGDQEDVVFDLDIGLGQRATIVGVDVDIGKTARQPAAGVGTFKRGLESHRIQQHGAAHASTVWLALVDAVSA